MPSLGGAWPLLALVLLDLALFPDVVFRRHVFFERDIHLFWYGQAESFVRCLATGSWPLWDPYMGFGQPILANPSAQALYPWTWLNLLAQPGTCYTFFVLSHVLLSAVGAYALGRRLQISRPGSLLAAALWIASGPFLSLVSLWHHLAGAAWIPWVLLAADHALHTPTLRGSLLWGATLAGQILAGSADMCAMTGLVCAAYALRFVRWERTGAGTNVRLVGTALLALAFGLVLSAGAWLPAVDQVRGSARFDLAEGIRTYWSVHPGNLLQVVLPVFSYDLPLSPSVQAILFEAREPFLNSLYLGLGALGLVAAALATAWQRARFFALVAGGAVLVALGRHGFAYEAATALLPPLRILRYPSKAMVLVAFSWSMLAGLGFEAWRAAKGHGRRWLLGVVLPAVAGLTLAFGVWFLARFLGESLGPLFLQRDPPRASFVQILEPTAGNALAAGLLGAAATFLALTRRRRPAWARCSAALLAILAVADLLFAHRNVNLTMPRELLEQAPATLGAIERRGPTRLYAFEYGARLLGRAYRRPEMKDAFTPVTRGLPAPIAQALGYQMYLPSSVARKWGLFGSYAPDILGLYPRPLKNLNLFFLAAQETPAFHRLLRIGGVSHVIALHTEGLEDLIPVVTVPSPFSRPIHVFRVSDPLPRAYAVRQTRILDGLPAYQALVDPSFDPEREVVLPQGQPVREVGRFEGQSRLVELAPDKVRIEASLSQTGHVVVLDAYDPGWKATVDGRPAPVLRANVAFRAVPVPAGRHVVDLRYRPESATIGVLTSALAALLALGLAIRSMVQAGRSPDGPPAGVQP